MSKRKQSKPSAARKKSSAGGSKGKVPAPAPVVVQTLYQKTRRRITDIAKRALSRLRGGNTKK